MLALSFQQAELCQPVRCERDRFFDLLKLDGHEIGRAGEPINKVS